MASAAEAETGALFENEKSVVPLCHSLDKWSTRNCQPLSNQKTPTLAESQMKKTSINAPNPLTCLSTGSKIMCGKANSTCSDAPD